MIIPVVGIDPSLRNWGMAKGTYDTSTGLIVIHQLKVVQPVLSKSKQVRQNSLDLDSAKQLTDESMAWCAGHSAVFVEVPVGSQSARSMASYGICVGVVGALRSQGIPIYEVTPTEVKMAGHGSTTATKQQMIDAAMRLHPTAKWPTVTIKGNTVVNASKAEHMADAVYALHAGIASDTFRQFLSLLQATQ